MRALRFVGVLSWIVALGTAEATVTVTRSVDGAVFHITDDLSTAFDVINQSSAEYSGTLTTIAVQSDGTTAAFRPADNAIIRLNPNLTYGGATTFVGPTRFSARSGGGTVHSRPADDSTFNLSADLATISNFNNLWGDVDIVAGLASGNVAMFRDEDNLLFTVTPDLSTLVNFATVGHLTAMAARRSSDGGGLVVFRDADNAIFDVSENLASTANVGFFGPLSLLTVLPSDGSVIGFRPNSGENALLKISSDHQTQLAYTQWGPLDGLSSDLFVIPEPSIVALFALGCGIVLRTRRSR